MQRDINNRQKRLGQNKVKILLKQSLFFLSKKKMALVMNKESQRNAETFTAVLPKLVGEMLQGRVVTLLINSLKKILNRCN